MKKVTLVVGLLVGPAVGNLPVGNTPVGRAAAQETALSATPSAATGGVFSNNSATMSVISGTPGGDCGTSCCDDVWAGFFQEQGHGFTWCQRNSECGRAAPAPCATGDCNQAAAKPTFFSRLAAMFQPPAYGVVVQGESESHVQVDTTVQVDIAAPAEENDADSLTRETPTLKSSQEDNEESPRGESTNTEFESDLFDEGKLPLPEADSSLPEDETTSVDAPRLDPVAVIRVEWDN